MKQWTTAQALCVTQMVGGLCNAFEKILQTTKTFSFYFKLQCVKVQNVLKKAVDSVLAISGPIEFVAVSFVLV